MSVLNCPSCSGSSFIHSLPDTNLCNCGIPLINGTNCDRCLKAISPSRLKVLTAQPSSSKQSPKQNKDALAGVMEPSSQVYLNSSKSIEDLIQAQNRTTHAVRAFVRFLFIQLTGITLAAFLWNLSTAFIDQQECFRSGSNCNGNGFLQFLAVVTVIVSVVWSSNAGWSELQKSEIN